MTHTENESLATLIAALATTAETVSIRPELLEQARAGHLALTTWESDGLIHVKAEAR